MDRYKNFGRIGEGSFGKVYKATDKTTDSIVALKVIKTVIFFVVNFITKNLIFEISETQII